MGTRKLRYGTVIYFISKRMSFVMDRASSRMD